jgi:HEAT repeat protein
VAAADWIASALTIAATLYLLLAAVIIAGRIRYDRRRRLFARIARLVDDASVALPDHPELGSQVYEVLRGWKLRTVERAMAEGHGSSAVLHACAAWLVEPLGEARLRDRAARGAPRWRRIAALRILAFARAEVAWELLERALTDDDQEIVRGTAVILGQVPHRRSAELLVKVLRDARQPQSQTAVFLQAHPGNIDDLLMPLLDEDDPALRYWGAVLAARHTAARYAEERLIALADDVEPPVRKAALDSLGAIRSRAALPVVLKRLDDPVPFVRAHAARALGHLGATVAASALAERLSDSDWWVRDAVKRSLLTLGRGAERALLAHLNNDDAFARNNAAEVLQHLGTFERLLLDEAKGPPDAGRQAALVKLADAGGLRVWDVVLAHLPERTRRRRSAPLEKLGLRAAAAEVRT